MCETLDLVDDHRFAVTLRSTSEAVRRTLALITEHFAGMMSEMDLGTLELVLAETLNNVVEHAMLRNGTGEVKLRITPRGDGLACAVLDNGLPMPDGRPPPEGLPQIGTILEELPEGGFGWSLIRMHVRDLQYDRRDGINILRFLLPRSDDSPR